MPIETDGSQFLKERYDLHNSEEVDSAADRTNKRNELNAEEGQDIERVGQDPTARIENYLNRLAEITDRKDPSERKDGLDALKRILHNNFVIKPTEIPNSYWEAQQRIAREQGHGDIEVTDQMREAGAEIIIADQESSLDKWVDYLTSEDATYPNWLKYYAARGVLNMGGYNKEKHEFSKRSRGTTKPFPDLDREALGYVMDVMEKHYSKEGIDLQNLDETDQAQLHKLLEGANFAKLYAWALEKVTPAEESELLVTDGKWVKYDQKSDHMPLVQSLQGHGTGWCTAGETTAETQLKAGDFYVYYSLDKTGQPTIPRAAIRMQGDSIAEVRGVAPEQNLDSNIADVVRGKMEEFPDGKSYEKKAYDMQMLTYVERKIQGEHALTSKDLAFLYEIDGSIEGFGYQRDPRISELRSQRDPESDMPVVFECERNQIARSIAEMNENTKAFVGQLEPGVFTKIAELPNIEHLYTNFPEGRIQRSELTIGGMTVDQMKREMEERNINISSGAQKMLEQVPTLEEPEIITTIKLRVGALGFTRTPNTADIYTRAEELGLELCPAETGPHQRLKDLEQPLNGWYLMAMEQIAGRDGYPNVFDLERSGRGLWLRSSWARPDSRWILDVRFVFRLRNVSHEAETPKPLPQFEI